MFVRKIRPSFWFICKRYSSSFYPTKSNNSIVLSGQSDHLYLHHDSNTEEQDVSRPTTSHLQCLKKSFKLDNFKPLQWSVIGSILNERRDNFAAMPTGYGKSLCYQYPAVYANSMSVVISPLISLMQDQIRSLQELRIPACYLGPSQSDTTVLKKLFANFYRVVYVTPETALSDYGMKLLQELNVQRRILLLCVDEAHCMLQWGNNFRPTYKEIGLLRSVLPSVPILALTGTVTNEEKHGIFHLLALKNPNEVDCSFDRPNLYYVVRPMTKEPFGDISQVLLDDKKYLNIEDGSVIIYCLTQKKTEKVANVLNKMGITCEVYHSGLCNNLRKKILNNFIVGQLKVIVATTAFGMGINKPDVRMVIHYGTPLSMEGYYQEVGRAGRDSKPALCVLYYSQADFLLHRYINKFNVKCQHKLHDAERRNSVMKRFISLTTCRRKYILEYFNCSLLVADTNKCCDNCLSNKDNINDDTKDLTEDVELLFNLINSFLPKTLGIKNIISILLGHQHPSMPDINSKLYFGKGSHHTREWWKELVFLLEINNYLKLTSRSVGLALYTKLELDYKSRRWLCDKSYGLQHPINLKLSNKMKQLMLDEAECNDSKYQDKISDSS